MWKLSEVLMVQLKGPSIQDCINDFLQDEKIEHMCTLCKRRTHVKKMTLLTDPSTLIIQLKRYRYEYLKDRATKRQDEIESSKTLTLPSGSIYTISSVINHVGDSPDEGHYNIFIYDPHRDSFVLLDDLDIEYDVQITADMNCLSYILIYTKNY